MTQSTKTAQVGDVFERLTVIETGLMHQGKRAIRVRCICGVENVLAATSVECGATRSCGCLRRDTNRARVRTKQINKSNKDKVRS